MSFKKLLIGLTSFAMLAIGALPASAHMDRRWDWDRRDRDCRFFRSWDKDWRFHSNRINVRCHHDRDWHNWIGIRPGWGGIYW